MNWSISTIIAFLNLLLIGADRFAISISGYTFRISIFFILAGLFLVKRNFLFQIPKDLIASCSFFIVAALLSVFNGISPEKSIVYFLWLLVSIFVITHYFYYIAIQGSIEYCKSLIFNSYRIFVALLCLESAYRFLGNEPGYWGGRPYLWFYEPSYAAIYLCFYFGASAFLFLKGSHDNTMTDFIIASIGIIVLQSATGFVSCSVLFVLIYLSNGRFWRKLIICTIVFLLLYIIANFLNLSENVMVGFIIQSLSGNVDVLTMIVNRGGNRVGRILMGLDAFAEQPLTGIGIGADKIYTEVTTNNDLSEEFAIGGTYDITGNPFINIFIEIAGTMGVIGVIGAFYLIFKLYKFGTHDSLVDSESKKFVVSLGCGLICMLISMQAEGTFLRFYIWSSIGLFLGATSRRSQAMPYLSKPKS
jgi:hypothetical protein